MTGEETFEFAAAIAGVSIGLAAALLLSALAVIGTWRLFRHASEASQAATRAALSVEDITRHLSTQPAPQTDASELRAQLAALYESQQRLEETTRRLMEASASTPPGLLDDIEGSISRLDATVGQMAASLTNLVQLLERQQERR